MIPASSVRPRGVRGGWLPALSVLLALAACEWNGDPPALRVEDACVVAFVIDGDSLACTDGREVRILLIDAPELAQAPWGDRARLALVDLAGPGTRLEAEYDVERLDDFDRHLLYLYLADGTMVNEEMAARGFALALVFRPNGRYEARIRAAVEAARAEGRGLWADGGFACQPRDFRAGRCR